MTFGEVAYLCRVSQTLIEQSSEALATSGAPLDGPGLHEFT